MNKLVLLLLIAPLAACAQSPLFVSTDHTRENVFSTNIEGPAFDKKGNLYVVNFEKDGTVGLVRPNGAGEVFVTLPEGSTANSIQFDSQGNMYLADFTGHNILRVDMKTKGISVFAHHDDFNQPNDICINRKNQIFASDPNWKDNTGQLWRIDPDGTVVGLDHDMGTTNGIALSPDEKVLYVNESVQRK
ncbi:MAG: SMP-30/gluconolactonase/LRE family protein, partial [Bacteroidota bacterium]